MEKRIDIDFYYYFYVNHKNNVCRIIIKTKLTIISVHDSMS